MSRKTNVVTLPAQTRRKPPPNEDPCPNEPWTQLGLARRLVAVYGQQMRYVPLWSKWLIWDGRRWTWDTTGQAARFAKAVARQALLWAADAPSDDGRQAAVKIALKAATASGVRDVLILTGTEPEIALDPTQLDADPWLLNVANGILDLRTRKLRPHDPAAHLTKITQGAYRPEAPRSEWDQFMGRVLPDEATRAYVQRLGGLSLLGEVREHILAIPYGAGSNGKSAWTSITMYVFGDYAIMVERELLIDRGHAHPTGIADLFGARLAVTQESDAGRYLAEGTVKALTGGDRIRARRMREDFWEFEPSHTVFLVTNHRPLIRGRDDGIWRRLRPIPFVATITGDEIQAYLDAHDGQSVETVLRSEADGILTWYVNGLADYLSGGLREPAQVTAATAEYRAESDALGRFIDQCCLTGPAMHVAASELFAAWQKWCAQEGEMPGTQTAFGRELSNRGFDKRKAQRVTWHGIGLPTDQLSLPVEHDET